MICYLITAGVVALGLLATWTSGRMWATAMPCGMRNGCTMMMLYSALAKAAANDGGGTRSPD